MASKSQKRIPFKVFRPLYLAIPPGVKREISWRTDKRGVFGIELRLDGESLINFDFSDWITEDGTIRHLFSTEPISPVEIDASRVGIQGVRASSIVSTWYDATFTPKVIVEGWRRHGNLIPFGEIVPHLIHRDVVLMHDYRYTCMLPSWDVCLTLPAYLLFCADISGFETRLSVLTELGDQIRKSLKGLTGERIRGRAKFEDAQQFLEKLHALEDELSLALTLFRAGFSVRFGERGGPDLYVNSVPCELKSRFPTNDGTDVEVHVPEGYTILDVYRLFILEVKKAEEALAKSRIFLANLSRTGAGMAYTEAVVQEKRSVDPSARKYAHLQADLRVMTALALGLQKKHGKLILPYTRYVGPDSRYTSPFPISLAKYQEAIATEHRDRGKRTDRAARPTRRQKD